MATVCAAMTTGLAADAQLIEETLPPAKGWSPIGVAFAPVQYLQFPCAESDVNGLRLGLVAGHNRQVNGIDIATVGSWVDGDLNGLSFAGIGNWCDGATFGIHFSSVLNYAAGTVSGFQVATVNSAYGINGAQLGVLNCASDGAGLQLGVWNMSESWKGIQIGLINMAMNYDGIQIGIGNIIGESPLTACVLFNAWF